MPRAGVCTRDEHPLSGGRSQVWHELHESVSRQVPRANAWSRGLLLPEASLRPRREMARVRAGKAGGRRSQATVFDAGITFTPWPYLFVFTFDFRFRRVFVFDSAVRVTRAEQRTQTVSLETGSTWRAQRWAMPHTSRLRFSTLN